MLTLLLQALFSRGPEVSQEESTAGHSPLVDASTLQCFSGLEKKRLPCHHTEQDRWATCTGPVGELSSRFGFSSCHLANDTGDEIPI